MWGVHRNVPPDRLNLDIIYVCVCCVRRVKPNLLKLKLFKAEGLTERAASSNLCCGKPGILAMATSWLLDRGKNANSRSWRRSRQRRLRTCRPASSNQSKADALRWIWSYLAISQKLSLWNHMGLPWSTCTLKLQRLLPDPVKDISMICKILDIMLVLPIAARSQNLKHFDTRRSTYVKHCTCTSCLCWAWLDSWYYAGLAYFLNGSCFAPIMYSHAKGICWHRANSK